MLDTFPKAEWTGRGGRSRLSEHALPLSDGRVAMREEREEAGP